MKEERTLFQSRSLIRNKHLSSMEIRIMKVNLESRFIFVLPKKAKSRASAYPTFSLFLKTNHRSFLVNLNVINSDIRISRNALSTRKVLFE